MRARAHFGFFTNFPFYVELVVDFKPEHVALCSPAESATQAGSLVEHVQMLCTRSGDERPEMVLDEQCCCF